MNTLLNLIKSAKPLDNNQKIVAFSRELYRLAIKFCTEDAEIGNALASLFDISVTALYLQNLGSNGWLYCRECGNGVVEPKLYYPFVNACPRCSLRNEFVFTSSRKPKSAVIGQSTSLILATFLDERCNHLSDGKCNILQLGGNGVVDAIAIENKIICLFEIKSAPLITFPVETDTTILKLISEVGDDLLPLHTDVTLPANYDGELRLVVSENTRIPIGSYKKDDNWPYNQIILYLSDENNFKDYIYNWMDTYNKYVGSSSKSGTYWLTNGCGQPRPRPNGWPARRDASGYESISDGKSSVGLDRTDDIKKGIYQVLKIGTHYKEFTREDGYEVYTLLASNIHAVKHHEDYLKEFEDMMWTIDSNDRSYILDKNANTTTIKTEGIHNLYDGLVTFTKSHFRNEWVKGRFKF